VIKLNRDQAMAIGALSVLALICVLAVGWSLLARSDAAQELGDNRDLLARLEARRASGANSSGRSGPARAPTAAFVNASTQGQAAAQLQAYFATAVGDQHATLISAGVEPTSREDGPDSIRIQATLDIPCRRCRPCCISSKAALPMYSWTR